MKQPIAALLLLSVLSTMFTPRALSPRPTRALCLSPREELVCSGMIYPR